MTLFNLIDGLGIPECEPYQTSSAPVGVALEILEIRLPCNFL